MLRRKKFLIGGIIIFIAVGYLGYTGFQGSATYYYSVSEFAEQENSAYGETIRVNGQVVPGSVDQEAGISTLSFAISEGGKSLPVAYQGVVPDGFKVGNEVVVEGSMNSDGIFQAHNIMVKCPSKYVPK